MVQGEEKPQGQHVNTDDSQRSQQFPKAKR